MNDIQLKGKIKDIEFSHIINDIEYQKANIYVTRENAEIDIIPLRFKSSSNWGITSDVDTCIKGNIRSYSQKLGNDKNRVSIYVFSYLDKVDDLDIYNYFTVDGRVCKIDKLRSSSNLNRFQFILANNIISSVNKQKLNNYLPVVLYGKLAEDNCNLNISDKILISGQLTSRIYKKVDNKGNVTTRTAIELVATNLERL